MRHFPNVEKTKNVRDILSLNIIEKLPCVVVSCVDKMSRNHCRTSADRRKVFVYNQQHFNLFIIHYVSTDTDANNHSISGKTCLMTTANFTSILYTLGFFPQV